MDLARELFLTQGYAATTVSAIAAGASVSVETVYKGFGSKPGLVAAIVERDLAGEGPVPADQRSDTIRDTEPNPRRILRAWAGLVIELAPRVSPLLTLVRDAAGTDPEVGRLLNQLDADRLERMTRNARGLHQAGHLRRDITVDRAADILWTYSSYELYDLLVTRRGWSLERYGRFVEEGMAAALLPTPSAG